MTVGRIGVAGAGTMGAGIAQIAALGGHETRLHDPQPEALQRGADRLRDQLRKGAERGRWSAPEAKEAWARVSVTPELAGLEGCDLVVEACPENLALKRELFEALAGICGPAAVLATNTSSLSVADVAAGVPGPERVCGMHFFNPPALMKLVEVVATADSAEEHLQAVEEVARAMGRQPVRCTDSPGFIVNRCNRPFALESLRILDEGAATHAQIDAVMREDGGYPMGPFELMDLIGIDVNLEVARSFYRQRHEPRWRPHPIQERMVAEGRLGRKSGRGFYDYAEGAMAPDGAALAPPAPARRAGTGREPACQRGGLRRRRGGGRSRRDRFGDAPWPEPPARPVRMDGQAGGLEGRHDAGRPPPGNRRRALRGRSMAQPQ